MAWGKAGSTTASGSTKITSSDTSDSETLQILSHANVASEMDNMGWTLNSDTGTNQYGYRSSVNGGTDSATTNSYMRFGGGASAGHDLFIVSYVVNLPTREKLFINDVNRNKNTGSPAPEAFEMVGKWINTSTATTSVQLRHEGSSNWSTSTDLTVLGSDITPTTGRPTNVELGSRWEETDTRKMYNYTAPQAATDDIFSTGTGWSGDTSTYPYNSTINGIGCDTSTLGEAVTKTVTTLSASGQWVLRFKVTRETGDLGDGLLINLGSSSASTSSLARMQDGNGLYPYGIHLIYFANSNNVYAGGSHNTSFAWDSSSTTSVTWSVGDSRWIEVSHPSSSAFTTKVYSNANFTGTADLTNVASTSGQTLNYDDITIGTKWTANRKHIDFEDMQIWNGVTTAPASNNTWEEIGT